MHREEEEVREGKEQGGRGERTEGAVDIIKQLESRRGLDRPTVFLSFAICSCVLCVCVCALCSVMTYPLLVRDLLEPCQHLFILEASEAKDGTTRLDRLNHLQPPQ